MYRLKMIPIVLMMILCLVTMYREPHVLPRLFSALSLALFTVGLVTIERRHCQQDKNKN